MLKIFKARLQQYMNHELSDVQAWFRKGRGNSDKSANIHLIIEKAREFQKNIFCFIDYAKAFDCVDHNKLWKIQEMGIPDHLTWLLRDMYAGQEATVELDMEELTGSISWMEYVKAVYCHPAYFTYMQSTSWEILRKWSTSWNQDSQE